MENQDYIIFPLLWSGVQSKYISIDQVPHDLIVRLLLCALEEGNIQAFELIPSDDYVCRGHPQHPLNHIAADGQSLLLKVLKAKANVDNKFGKLLLKSSALDVNLNYLNLNFNFKTFIEGETLPVLFELIDSLNMNGLQPLKQFLNDGRLMIGEKFSTPVWERTPILSMLTVRHNVLEWLLFDSKKSIGATVCDPNKTGFVVAEVATLLAYDLLDDDVVPVVRQELLMDQGPLSKFIKKQTCVKLLMRHQHRELSFLTRSVPNMLADRLNADVASRVRQHCLSDNVANKFSIFHFSI